MGRGQFIVFEGPEGAGKSTQTRLLAQRLAAHGCDVVTTREPGGTPLGERVREIVLDHAADNLTPAAEALLYTAARAQHVAEVIEPSLASGKVVVCDRFADSTLAYQGGGRGLPLEPLEQMQGIAMGDTKPDLKILLDLDPDIGLSRRFSEEDQVNRFDRADLAFHRRVRQTFLKLAERDRDTWVVVDALQPVQAISDLIFETVMEDLRGRSHRDPGKAQSLAASEGAGR